MAGRLTNYATYVAASVAGALSGADGRTWSSR